MYSVNGGCKVIVFGLTEALYSTELVFEWNKSLKLSTRNPDLVLLFPLPSTTSKAFVSSSNKLSDTVSSSKSTLLSILPISFMV